MKILALLLLLSFSIPAYADEPTPLRWDSREAIPSRISDALVVTNLVLDGVDAFRDDNNRERWNYVCRNGLAYLSSALVKWIVERERPNGKDFKSMPSMHTAFAVSSAGYKPAWGASFAIGVAWGRQAGGWHYTTDTIAGAGIGLTSQRLCNTLVR